MKIERLKDVPKARIGLYSAGLKAYWNQFEGLHGRLTEYGAFLQSRLAEYGEVCYFGMVDDEKNGREAGEWFNQHNVDIVFCHAATYFTSASVVPVHQICKAPLVILNLQPSVQMNYPQTSTGEWLAHCVACPVPELCNALHRCGIPYRTVSGLLGLEKSPAISVAEEATANRPEAIRAWKEIGEWARAAGMRRMLRYARFGFLGNNYSGMLDMYSDPTMLQAETGIHVELLEMCDLDRSLQKISDTEVAEKLEMLTQFFRIEGDSPADPIAKRPDQQQLSWSARVAAAQERISDMDSE